MTNTNSLMAYRSLDLTNAQKMVFEAVSSSEVGMTMNQVANALKRQKNAISGRFGELVKAGHLEVFKHVVENGSRVGVYRVKKKEVSNMEWYRQKTINIIRQQNSIVNLGPDALF